ncbi:MAG: hypothetical protein RPR40_10120 [Bermanella sp.]
MIDFTRYPTNKLPLPLLKSHRLKRNSMLLVTKQDSGYARKRRRFKNPPADMPFTLLLSSEQFDLFEGWYHHVINSGVNWFVMPVKLGAQLIDHQCQFVGDYSSSSKSQSLWKVAGKLKIKNLRVISEEDTIAKIHDIDSPTQSVQTVLDVAVSDYLTPD